jgi:hypothetical protein
MESDRVRAGQSHWGQAYIELALRIERLYPGYVDGYYGPVEWPLLVKAEDEPFAPDLVKQARRLALELPEQHFAPRREAYLARQVTAMETICRKLDGQEFSLEEEVRRFFDIEPEWTPESLFDEAHALYEEALPGEGSLAERIQARRMRYEMGPEKAHLLPGFMDQALAEVRRRTATFVNLPEDESFEIRTVTNQPWGAYNWYLGRGRSRIELNTDLPTNLSGLLDLMAHEGYPGHHAEHALKEQLLYQEQDYLENAILLINTPECVISEGIATMAGQMIFGPGEMGRWLAEEIYPAAGIEPDGADMDLLARATELLAGVRGNAVFMLHAHGQSDDEVVRYLMRYLLLPEDRARKSLEFLKSPLWRSYTFTYFYGKRLMKPLLQGADRLAIFRRLLTEQTYPSLLSEWQQA